MAQFRKTKDGSWVVFALESECADVIDVTLKSGAIKSVEIERWSRSFQTDNGPACYGTPVADKPKAAPPLADEEDPF